MCASRIRTRVCPLRVRRFVHWATAARPIDFMLCSVFMSSWQRIIDSAFAFTILLPSVERQCPHCLLVTTFLFSSLWLNSRDAKCRNQKLLLPVGLEPVSESSESGALSLSSAARHIDFHLLRRIYVAFVAHSIALSLQLILFPKVLLMPTSTTVPVLCKRLRKS